LSVLTQEPVTIPGFLLAAGASRFFTLIQALAALRVKSVTLDGEDVGLQLARAYC
jgi:hypothetical protein